MRTLNCTTKVSSVTPLIAMHAVALDTETTGLDVSKARLIQVGGIRIDDGLIIEEDQFNTLIDPGVPIPAATTAIHGLSDEDVKGQPSFEEINPAFNHWLGQAIVIGYAIGFDFAVFRRECERSGIPWQSPRCLDIRLLVAALSPSLPDYSLDSIASWLGIEIRDRHSAIGDARAAARIFLAILPRLHDRGIRTLAEAERLCLSINDNALSGSAIGWEEAAHRPVNDALDSLARIDSYPYRHRIHELMTRPAAFIPDCASLADALKLMMDKKLSSVFVHLSNPPQIGIVTERDILRALNQDTTTALQKPVQQVAHFPLESVAQDAFVYRAIGRMFRKKIRHLGVHDEQHNIVGALSARDLLRQRAQDAISLGDAIEESDTAEQLASVWAHLALVAKGLVREEVDARDIAAVISREVCALTRRACQIAEHEMQQNGLGSPPVPYAMLVLGSAGRGESLLAMDQDNAIVYLRGELNDPTDQWFEQLGIRVADMLNLAGIPYCKGGIMAKNPAWRMSVNRWKDNISTWIHRHTPEDILNTDIFFDAVTVHGDQAIAQEIVDLAFSTGARSQQYLKLMAVNAVKFKTPVSWLGRFVLDEGRMDVKMGGIMPIFSAARTLAIEHNIRILSTPGRLNAVKSALPQAPIPTLDNLTEAHRILLSTMLEQQIADIDQGIPLSNRIDPARLTRHASKQLKWALRQIPNISNILGDPVTVG